MECTRIHTKVGMMQAKTRVYSTGVQVSAWCRGNSRALSVSTGLVIDELLEVEGRQCPGYQG